MLLSSGKKNSSFTSLLFVTSSFPPRAARPFQKAFNSVRKFIPFKLTQTEEAGKKEERAEVLSLKLYPVLNLLHTERKK